MTKGWGMLAAATLLAGGLGAAVNPDGKGWVALSGALMANSSSYDISSDLYSPHGATHYDVHYGFTMQQEGGIDGALAVAPWLSLKAGWQGYRDSAEHSIHFGNPAYTNSTSTFESGGARSSLGATVYPAAWAQGSYRPSDAANPDGWSFWPSLSYEHGWIDTSFEFKGTSGRFESSNGIDQDHRLGLALPLGARWTFLGAWQWAEGWNETRYSAHIPFFLFTQGRIPRAPNWYFDEELTLGLRCYLGGAGDSPGRWSAHLGAPGRWRTEFRYRRALRKDNWSGEVHHQDYRLELARALPWGLAGAFGLEWREDGPKGQLLQVRNVSTYNPWSLRANAALSWTWGLETMSSEQE